VSSLLDSRAGILAALAAGGVRTATTGRLTAPCVLVEPGDPWTEWTRMPGRNGRWRLTAIAGKADAEAALAALGELVDAIDAALKDLYGVALPTWTRPLDLELGGTIYAATTANVTYAHT
jgi:hypothetical protein